ncbi:UNVERIFIED_CONTAM: hypothetical protein LK11_38725 [Mumia flava]
MAAAGALLLSACGSAGDTVDSADPTSDPSASTPPVRTLPPTEGSEPTESATPEQAAAPRPSVGECHKPQPTDVALQVSDDDTAAVACKGATAQTYLVRPMPKQVRAAVTDYDTSEILRTARKRCEPALADWLGVNVAALKTSQFGFVVGVPSAAQSADGASWMRCDVTLDAGNRLTALPKKTKNALDGSKKAKKYGSCVRGDIRTAAGTVLCTKKHRWRAVDAIKLGSGKAKFPGRKDIQGTMRDKCGGAVRSWLGTREAFEYGYVSPSKYSWGKGERWGTCFAKTKD